MLFEKVIKLNLYSEARRMLIKTQENGEGFWYSQYSSTFHWLQFFNTVVLGGRASISRCKANPNGGETIRCSL